MARAETPAVKLGIRLAGDLHEWLEGKIESGQFVSFTHAIEVALRELRSREEANSMLSPEVRRAIERSVAEEIGKLGVVRPLREESPARRSRNTTSKK